MGVKIVHRFVLCSLSKLLMTVARCRTLFSGVCWGTKGTSAPSAMSPYNLVALSFPRSASNLRIVRRQIRIVAQSLSVFMDLSARHPGVEGEASATQTTSQIDLTPPATHKTASSSY